MGLVCSSDNFKTLKTTKNILITGNGLDLEFKIKSKYSDFLKYILLICLIYSCFKILEILKEKQKTDCFSKLLNKELNDLLCRSNFFSFFLRLIGKDFKKKYSNDYSLYRLSLKKFHCLIKNSELDLFITSINGLFFNNLFNMLFSHSCDSVESQDMIYMEQVIHGKYEFFQDNLNFILELDCKNFIRTSNKPLLTLDSLKSSFLSHCNNFSEILFNAEKTINGWLDVERFIECLITEDDLLNNKFYGEILQLKPRIYVSEKECALLNESLYKFSSIFAEFVNSQNYKTQNISWLRSVFSCIYMNDYKESCDNRNQDIFRTVELEKDIDFVFDFNYTNTTDLIFSDLVNSGTVVNHVNGEAGQNIVTFGCSKKYELSLYPPNVHVFSKQFRNSVNNIANKTLKLIPKHKFNLIVFGHSCSPADDYIFSKLFLNDNFNIALIFCYDRKALSSIRSNLEVILGDEAVEKEYFDRKIFFCVKNDFYS